MATGPDGIRAGPVTPAEIITPLTPSGDVRQEVFHRSMQQMLGQQLQGQVVSRLADGSFLVNVNGATARMQLPEGAKAGDTLPMTLATLNPRPTFTLGQEHGSATVVVLQEPVSEELTYGRQPGAAGLRRQPDTPAAARAALQAASAGETEASGQAAQLAASGQLDDESLVYNPRAPVAPAAGQLPEGAAPAEAGTAGAANGASGPANANAAAALARAVMARAPGLPSLPDDGSSAQTMLSNAGRLITQVLQAARDLPDTIIGKTPVIDSPDTPPAQMAAALQETLDRSGVFYESHLRQWADGKLALTELAREPQAAGAPARGAGQAAQDGTPAFPQLVNLQLNTLEQHSVQWSGQVWPGQQMQWEVRQQQRPPGSHDGGGGADDDARAWQSSMRFQFPLLGQIAATIHLVGGAVHVEVRAASEESAAMLRQGSGALADALDAAGSPLHSFMVKHDDAA